MAVLAAERRISERPARGEMSLRLTVRGDPTYKTAVQTRRSDWCLCSRPGHGETHSATLCARVVLAVRGLMLLASVQ